jgi:hypothetical protein
MFGKSGKLAPTSRAVIQIDPESEEVINRFDCILEASRQTHIDNSAISKVCRKIPKYNTAGGFI